ANDLLIFCGSDGNSSSLAGPLQGGRIAVAQRHQFGLWTKRQPGQVILQCDSSTSDDGDTNLFHASYSNESQENWASKKAAAAPAKAGGSRCDASAAVCRAENALSAPMSRSDSGIDCSSPHMLDFRLRASSRTALR